MSYPRNLTPMRIDLPRSPMEAYTWGGTQEMKLVLDEIAVEARYREVGAFILTLQGEVLIGPVDSITDLVITIRTEDKNHPRTIEIDRICTIGAIHQWKMHHN